MVSEESFLVLVHYRGLIKKKTRSGIKFTHKDPLSIFLKPTTSFADFLNSIIQKLGLQRVKRVAKLFYRIPISVLRDDVKYDLFVIGSDKDLEVLFHCRRQFPEVKTPELLAKLVDVLFSSGGSNWNTQTPTTTACSSSRPIGASSSVPVIAPQEVRGTPDGIDDALSDDDDTDDVEPDIIADDSGYDIVASNSEGIPGKPIGFGAKDTQGTGGLSKFQDKEEAMLSVKTYSIRLGVQYKVVESDYRKYLGKCTEFGNGCTWLIRISLYWRRGIWERHISCLGRLIGGFGCPNTSSSLNTTPIWNIIHPIYVRNSTCTSLSRLDRNRNGPGVTEKELRSQESPAMLAPPIQKLMLRTWVWHNIKPKHMICPVVRMKVPKLQAV
ncbi:uncharacterized protein LOC107640261 [Arachis ipaensis]|uniref:uncharacterized protein LOC107640261 n=1 Tax=Arachis ipaensis TaxID=130454 RepID=UPI0007AFB5F3|nr:uncharacterized protein LOC107640261 [Arachis ipaensis]